MDNMKVYHELRILHGKYRLIDPEAAAAIEYCMMVIARMIEITKRLDEVEDVDN